MFGMEREGKPKEVGGLLFNVFCGPVNCCFFLFTETGAMRCLGSN
jgi:hypothetical protein